MRTKAEILKQAQENIHSDDPEPQRWSKQMYLNVEVMIDIRDILRRDMDEMIKRAIKLKTRKRGLGNNL